MPFCFQKRNRSSVCSTGNPSQRVQSYVSFSSLNRADISAMNFAKIRESVLTQIHLFAHGTNVFSNDNIDIFSEVAIGITIPIALLKKRQIRSSSQKAAAHKADSSRQAELKI
jgi:hypothetical protein